MKRKRRAKKKCTPKRRATRRVKRTARHAPRTPRAAEGTLDVTPLGFATQLMYKPSAGAVAFRVHQFGGAVRVYAHSGGRYLIIGPVRIRGGQIEG